MKLLMKSRSDACATRLIECFDYHISYELRIFGWWRDHQRLSTGFGLTIEHIVNHYSHVFVWDGERLRDVRNEILQRHKVNTGGTGPSAPVLRRADFTGRRRSVGDGDSQTTGLAK